MLRRIFRGMTSVELSATIPPKLRLPLPSLESKEFTLSKDKTIGQLCKEILDQDPILQSVKFVNNECKDFPQDNLISDAIGKTFYLMLDNAKIRVLPGPHLLGGKHFLHCREHGVSLNDSRLLGRFLSHLDSSLPPTFTNELLEQKIEEAKAHALSTRDEDIRTLEKQAKVLQDELQPLEQQLNNIQAQAEAYASRVLKLGLSVMTFQWSSIGYLTFVVYGWDVMEPVAYMVGLSWGVVGYLFFMTRKQEFDVVSFRQSLIDSRYSKLLYNNKVDLEHMEMLRKNLAVVQKQIAMISVQEIFQVIVAASWFSTACIIDRGDLFSKIWAFWMLMKVMSLGISKPRVLYYILEIASFLIYGVFTGGRSRLNDISIMRLLA